MRVWELHSTSDSLVLILENDYDMDMIEDKLIGEKINYPWAPIKTVTYRKGRKADFPHLRIGIPIFTEEVKAKLDYLIHPFVEYLPITHTDYNMYIVNVLLAPDIVNYEKTKIIRKPSGAFSSFEELQFIRSMVEKYPIFKIKDRPHTVVYVNDTFRDAALRLKIKGMEFREVWDSDITDEIRGEQKQRYQSVLQQIESAEGPRYSWGKAFEMAESGKALVSDKWKIQANREGEVWLGILDEETLRYNWINPAIIPPILLELNWLETETENLPMEDKR